MKKNIKTLASLTMMVAALMVTWGCSSSDDDKDTDDNKKPNLGFVIGSSDAAPKWSVDWSANDNAPDWQSPDPTEFESWAVLMVKLDSILAPYASEKDMMALFINYELRAASMPSSNLNGQIRDEDGNVYFILKVFSNNMSGSTVNFMLKYYSNNLHQMFTLEDEEKFVAEQVYGVDEDFEPPMFMGSSKYPVLTELKINTRFTEESGITPSSGDMVGVFVGEECRGVKTLTDALESTFIAFPVFGREEGENATLRYYSAEKNSVLTFVDTFKLTSGVKNISINI